MMSRKAVLILVLLCAFADAFRPSFPVSRRDSRFCRTSRPCPLHRDFWRSKQAGRRRSTLCTSIICCKSGPDESAAVASRWKPQLKRPVLVLLGKQGSGKKVLGEAVSRRLDVDFWDGHELSNEAEVELLSKAFAESEEIPRINESLKQERKLSAVVVSSVGEDRVSNGGISQVLQQAKERGHLIVHVHAVKVEADVLGAPAKAQCSDVEMFNRNTSSHRFCLLECVPSSSDDVSHADVSNSSEPSVARQWATLRNMELAVEELQAMVYRLVSPPCPLSLGSMIEPIPDPLLLSAPTHPASHAAELRVDVWLQEWMRASENPNASHYDLEMEASMLACFALSRRWLDCPLMWAVRGFGQGGRFKGAADEYVRLVQLGAELGADLLAVEASWPEEVQEKVLASKGSCKSILSFTDDDERFYSAGELRMTLAIMANAWGSLLDAVQVVVASPFHQQCADIRQAIAEHWRGGSRIPASVYCNGGVEQASSAAALSPSLLSRMTNPLLSLCAPTASLPRTVRIDSPADEAEIYASHLSRARAQAGLVQPGSMWLCAGKCEAWRTRNAAALAAGWRQISWWGPSLKVEGSEDGEKDAAAAGASGKAERESNAGRGLDGADLCTQDRCGGMIVLEQHVGPSKEEVGDMLRECQAGGSPGRGGLRLGGLSFDPNDEELVSMAYGLMAQGDIRKKSDRGDGGQENGDKDRVGAREVGSCSLTSAAIAIGAVTCVTRTDAVFGGGLLHGDNCVWKGVYDVITRQDFPGDVQAVVVGDGSLARACCYALFRLPLSTMRAPPILISSSAESGGTRRVGEDGLLSDCTQIVAALNESSLHCCLSAEASKTRLRLVIINAMRTDSDSSSCAMISDDILTRLHPVVLDVAGGGGSFSRAQTVRTAAPAGARTLSPLASRAQAAGCRVIGSLEFVAACAGARMQQWACLGNGERESEDVKEAIRCAVNSHAL